MRIVLDGIAYNTDTATKIIGGSNPHSDAWWGLYRAQTGGFFKIVVDHHGDLQECRLLSAVEARASLEKSANHLVEEYFGSMPEPSSTRFSRRTVIAAIDVIIGARSQAAITSFLIDLGPAVYKAVRDENFSAQRRGNDLKQFVDGHPAFFIEEGASLEDLLVEKAASDVAKEQEKFFDPSEAALPSVMEHFRRQLEQEGFVVTEGVLRRTLPTDVGLLHAESELMRLFNRYNFSTAKGHLEQAFENHGQGNWAAANGQLRTCFDALLDSIAEHLDPTASTLGSGQLRRTKLAALNFLSIPLNEWNNDGKGFINGLVKRLHPQGAHPGLSDEEDCTFRLHVVLLTAALLLRRFDKWRRP